MIPPMLLYSRIYIVVRLGMFNNYNIAIFLTVIYTVVILFIPKLLAFMGTLLVFLIIWYTIYSTIKEIKRRRNL